MSNYNGWTNYATWRVHLEIISDYAEAMDLSDYAGDPDGLELVFGEYAYGVLKMSAHGIALDYARAFLADANFYEMAVDLLSDAGLLEPEEVGTA
jgi:hypothetical protein